MKGQPLSLKAPCYQEVFLEILIAALTPCLSNGYHAYRMPLSRKERRWRTDKTVVVAPQTHSHWTSYKPSLWDDTHQWAFRSMIWGHRDVSAQQVLRSGERDDAFIDVVRGDGQKARQSAGSAALARMGQLTIKLTYSVLRFPHVPSLAPSNPHIPLLHCCSLPYLL